MNRPLAFICALLFAGLSVSSACLAQGSNWIGFTLRSDRSNPAKIHASFRDVTRPNHGNSWSTEFNPSDLVGFEVSPFHAPGSRPLHFAIIREAGRLDCAGNGGQGEVVGNCAFAEDPAFTRLLVSRGIARPTSEQAFALMAVNVRRELIDSLAQAHFPTPTIDNLMGLSALGVDGRYIEEIAHAGYRPQSLERLLEFKALGVTPQWIGGFARIGYANVSGDGLVQMRALGITPEYIEGFQRIGYRNLGVEDLLQLKALGVTPQFASSLLRPGVRPPAVGQLVQMKIFGARR